MPCGDGGIAGASRGGNNRESPLVLRFSGNWANSVLDRTNASRQLIQSKISNQTTEEGMPYLLGSAIYSLRCSLLHEGNPNADNVQLTRGNASLPIDHFVLKGEKKRF